MPGSVVQIIPKRTYDFNSPPAGTTTTVLAVKGIDVTNAFSGDLVVRLHGANGIVGTAAGISVLVKLDAMSAEDPSVEFTAPTANIAQVTIYNSLPTAFTGTSNAFIAALVTPLPAYLRVYVQGIQGTSAVGLAATLSAELVLRW